jgi:hypothetical protein
MEEKVYTISLGQGVFADGKCKVDNNHCQEKARNVIDLLRPFLILIKNEGQ